MHAITSAALAAEVGFSHAGLHRLVQGGVLVPSVYRSPTSGRGGHLFSKKDVAVARVVRALTEHGVPLDTVGPFAEELNALPTLAQVQERIEPTELVHWHPGVRRPVWELRSAAFLDDEGSADDGIAERLPLAVLLAAGNPARGAA